MSKNLVEMFENIRNLCEELDEQDCSIFSEPATAEILDAWEIKNGIEIPEEYRKWLQISKYSNICGGLLQLFMPSANGYYGCLVPPEYVVIGNMIGDGERICFLRSTGEIVRFCHGKVMKVGNLKNLLLWVTEYLEIILVAKERIQYVTKNELLRRQGIQEFWLYERQLLSNGQCTRNWNFDEIEYIYNISTATGKKRKYAGKPVVYSQDGKMTVDENGTPIYFESHYILSYSEQPECIGDWRRIRALTPEESIVEIQGRK